MYGRLARQRTACGGHTPATILLQTQDYKLGGGGLIMRGQAEELLLVVYTCGPPSAV